MSAAGSIIGQCAECCECPTATAEWDSRSASKSKSDLGYPNAGKYWGTRTVTEREDLPADTSNEEFNGSCPGSDPYRITTQTFTGAGFDRVTVTNYGGTPTVTASGSFVIVFVQTDYEESSYGNCDYSVLKSIRTITDTYTYNATTSLWDTVRTDRSQIFVPTPSDTTTTTSGTSGTGSGGPYTTTTTYSNEITTPVLKTNTVAALPAYDDDWNDTAGSYANLSTDELTYSIRESRYRLRFKIPKVGFGTCYHATWVERFTPEGGGTPTDTPRNWQWAEGDIPDDYDPDDPATYPIAGESGNGYFELPVPAADGTTTVEDIEVFCRNCEEVSNIIPSI